MLLVFYAFFLYIYAPPFVYSYLFFHKILFSKNCYVIIGISLYV